MTLDVLALSGEIRAMSALWRGEVDRLAARLAQARALLHAEAADWEFWKDAVEDVTDSPFLLAQPTEPLTACHDLPPCPESYAVAAADGSQIDVEYHGVAACWLVNIGAAVLQYGDAASFSSITRPTIGYLPHDLVIEDGRSGRSYTVEGPVLAAERDLREGLTLAEIALALPDDLPRLAMQDGTLIRWSLQSFDEFLQNRFLGDYLSYLETMRVLPCPVVSYMSQPRSPEATGLVRFLHVRGDMRAWRERYPRRNDDPWAGVVDHLIFADLLAEGQRSATFASRSRINVDFYGPHLIHFFYLKVGREIARVEFPAWVAAEGYLPLVHAVVYDQTRRGMGYPSVVQRAHEQAVIHDSDHRSFRAVLDRLLIEADVPHTLSAKTASKLRPRV